LFRRKVNKMRASRC